jgi:hypothetical protein
MSTSRWVSVAAVLSAFAFAAMPAAAQAVNSHWYTGAKELKRGAKPTAVKGHGKLSIQMLSGPQAGQGVACEVKSLKGDVWNPAPKGAGKDSLTGIAFAKCKSTPTNSCKVTALAFPWESVLVREYPEELDLFEAITLEVSCSAGGSTVLAGSLEAPVVGGTIDLVGSLENNEHTVGAEVELLLHLKAKGGTLHTGP